MGKSKIFLWLSIFFISGIGARSFFEIFYFLVLFFCVFAISILTVFYKKRIAVVAAFCILFFCAGIFILDRKLEFAKDVFLTEKAINEKAIIVREPELKDNYQKIIVQLDVEKEKVLINTSLYPEYFYGDEIRVSCVLKIPENKEDFDYRMYLAKDGIKYICDKAKLEKMTSGKGNIFYSSILKIKNSLENNISKSIPQPEAALANGVLFGGSSAMSKEVQNSFSRTGMTHIVAVSGYNVTIIAEYLVLLGIFLGLWRNQALWLAIFGIFLFVAMIGFPSSAVRAGVMGSVLVWAMKNGRLSNSFNAIIFAGAIMLVFNPMLLRWDIGFQLSFLATLGIVSFSPLAEKIALKKFNPMGLSEIIFLSLCAQIFVIPIIMYNFKTVSLVSLLANALVLPIVPISMLLSFLAAISGFFLNPTWNFFAWLAHLSLYYEIEVIEFFSNLSWASIVVKNLGVMSVIAYYIALGIILFFVKKWKMQKSKTKNDI